MESVAGDAHEIGPRLPRDIEEGDLEQAENQRDALDAAVGAGGGDRQQRDAGQRQADVARHAIKFAYAGDAGEFGDQRAESRRGQPGQRQQRPGLAETLADQLAKTASGEQAETGRQFLNQIKGGRQREDQRQQAIAPLCAGLRRRDDIAGVGVGQHDQQARSPRGQPTENRHESPRRL